MISQIRILLKLFGFLCVLELSQCFLAHLYGQLRLAWSFIENNFILM